VSASVVTSTTLPTQPPSPQQQQPQQTPQSPNEGQRALAEMRRQRAESRDAELRKVREMKMADEQVQQAPAAIPEKVAQRMGARMLPFVGVPLFLGLGTFVGFWYMATYRDLEFQPALVATSTIVILATSLVVGFFLFFVLVCSFIALFVRAGCFSNFAPQDSLILALVLFLLSCFNLKLSRALRIPS
jgi:hypothetical protein